MTGLQCAAVKCLWPFILLQFSSVYSGAAESLQSLERELIRPQPAVVIQPGNNFGTRV